MKNTGIVRGVDKLGRVVIPMELRKTLALTEKDSLEIYVDRDRIVLKKYEPGCVICGSTENIECLSGKNICKKCMIRISIGGINHG